MSRRALAAVGLLLALVLAGVVSYYASGSPDGLERVAGDQGITRTEKDHHAADGPFADYATRGIDDERVSGGVAGVVGVLVVLALAGGVAWVVRRRGPADADEPHDSDRTTPAGKA